MDANDILNYPGMKKLFNEAKWMLLLGTVIDKEILGEGAARPIYEFLKVFYDHDVEADVVVEALNKLNPLQEQSKEDISSSDLTSFIKVLNDIQKKKGEKNATEE